jgi:hypothetical protein
MRRNAGAEIFPARLGDFGSKRSDPLLARDLANITSVIIVCGELLKARTMLQGLKYAVSSKERYRKLGSIDRDGIL